MTSPDLPTTPGTSTSRCRNSKVLGNIQQTWRQGHRPNFPILMDMTGPSASTRGQGYLGAVTQRYPNLGSSVRDGGSARATVVEGRLSMALLDPPIIATDFWFAAHHLRLVYFWDMGAD